MGSHGTLARRAVQTETPIMVLIQEVIRGAKDALSLAQGVVYWQPPKPALDKVKELVWEPSVSRYGADEGLPELREALVRKVYLLILMYTFSLKMEIFLVEKLKDWTATLDSMGKVNFNGFSINAPFTLSRTSVCFPFLHIAAHYWDLVPHVFRFGSQDMCPTLEKFQVLMESRRNEEIMPQFYCLLSFLEYDLVIFSCVPGKNTEVCRSINNYMCRYFMYDGLKHSCVEGNHIVNIFSFSKAYGMMGWRVGYIAYPTEVAGFGAQLLKIQDNIPICAAIISQRLALYSLEVGPEWVTEQVKDLVKNRAIVLEALSPLGDDAVKGGEGAIYLWAKLPDKCVDDYEVIRWLATKHGVVVIPGSACGCPGHLRISFGGLLEDDCRVAAARLRKGLEELARDGMVH
ncbi:aromatic aminotransferase ISS1-like [Camellia sinensis]|uniref:aromatic aminotransferase ISS1-like n=1 Tax=Camellia sinensis TaxID=4442 RepID=UPI00103625D3|nr:aromatic aminotransferase ISS1-like [Camellia sinensis]